MISSDTLELLEFPKLLRLISDHVHSEASRLSVLDLRPLADKSQIESRLQLIAEVRRISHEGKHLALAPFPDISPLIPKIRPQGAVLDAIELAGFIPVLTIASDVSLQLREEGGLPFLKDLTAHLTGFPEILRVLRRSIDAEGNILDTASSLLSELRSGIRRLEGRMRKKLEEIVRDERLSPFLQDDFVTTRSGRWVIPVRMDSKGMVPGVVHDISKSGETAFIEPLSIIHLSNELENLVADQKAEEIRILRNICSSMRSVADEIAAEFQAIVYLDTLNAIASFSDILWMTTPEINDLRLVLLSGARHPLLQLSLDKADSTRRVVPLDVQLGGGHTVMVITGANAGGKTITIKTIGLLLLMALSGMPVPADSGSSFPLAENLLVDIGDEQSIEDNLSTFSAHISNISGILAKKDAGAVILIDELGTGTDPDEGAALACAILKEIRRSGALVFATTHLSDIKGFVHRTAGMLNASMEFDLRKLTPLYKLRVGEPGQSHALEIAKQYGLPGDLLEDAKGMLGSAKVEFDRMISDLNLKRAEYEDLLVTLHEERRTLAEKSRLLEERLSESEKKEHEVLASAYREASDVILDTKRRMNAFLDEIRKQEKSERQKTLRRIEANQEAIVDKLRELTGGDGEIPPVGDIKAGTVVYVRSLGYDAPVIDVNRNSNRLRIAARNMEIEVPLSDIRFKRGKSMPSSQVHVHRDTTEDEVSSRINLVGTRVDEALSRLEHFLNDAALAELQEVRIIHGLGKGLLMKAIHEHLGGHPLVRHFRSATTEEGGLAVTMVKMR